MVDIKGEAQREMDRIAASQTRSAVSELMPTVGGSGWKRAVGLLALAVLAYIVSKYVFKLF